ncbi:hypothetical protein [Chryseosolibacter indicus]|uniref:AAA+ ATPase domain-containing protein n=1 Tax=Chryseosolibacter indicus TaxID=2782351 RepID=A0ABS5VNB6_9BACT|nr:hypothetical protein [Chryseosolibacter indicus]MBT1702933.1 hypothetical protein [Chryseosolibacter indicus]
MAKVLGLRQLLQKKYTFLEGLPDEITRSFGKLVDNFVMIVWGMSGNGKSNFMMQFLKAIMPFGKVLYVALEEGFEATTQLTALRQLSENEHNGKIEFADHEMNYEELDRKLSKKKSPKFIVIDSVQYWNITYEDYKRLKEKFKKKTFIFISHASGKLPDGRTADKIRYDSGIKVRIEGYVAFVTSRYGGNVPYVIWEDGAKKYWGKKFRSIISGIEPEKEKKTTTTKKAKNEKTPIHENKPLEESGQLVLGEQQVQRESETVLPQLGNKPA